MIRKQIWEFINSAIGIWLFTSLVGGAAVWAFERYLDSRDRHRIWMEAEERLALEYEGRLSQYSEWFLTNLKPPQVTIKGIIKETFKNCVTPSYLRQSLKVISGEPNFKNDGPPQPYIACESFPRFQAIFPEYAKTSTVGLLIELRRINKNRLPEEWGKNPEDSSLVVTQNEDAHHFRQHVLEAVNNFLNPDAIIPMHIESINDLKVQEFRKAMHESFYGIGPADLWYGDVFAGQETRYEYSSNKHIQPTCKSTTPSSLCFFTGRLM